MKLKNKTILQYLFILIIFGILTGILLSYYIEPSDHTILKTYFIQLNKNKLLFSQECFQNLIIFLLFLLLSTSVLGPVLISFCLFSKGVQVGYSCILLIQTYAYKGILGIILSLIPRFILDLFVLILITHFTLKIAIQIFYSCISKKNFSLQQRIHPFLNSIITILLMIILTSYIKVTLIQQLSLIFQKLIS